MTTLHQTEVDGVRCFWVDSGRPTLASWLLFRSGSADEPLNESGWLHLLEHSVLHGKGGGALHVNGFVSPLITGFETHGPAQQVISHLREVTAWLADPDLTDLNRERGVLRAEAGLRGGGPGERALAWRYGSRGPGVLAMGEPGLGRATPDGLRERSHRVFTQGNAALVLDGPPPDDLELHLPAGELLSMRPAVPCEDQLPAWYVDQAGLVLSGVVARSTAATLLSDLLQRDVRERFRNQDGASYAPWSWYEAVDADNALVVVGADIAREAYPTLAKSATKLVRWLSDDGPKADHLRELVESRVQGVNDPYNTVATAGRAAHEHLRGRPVLSHEQMVEELEAVTVEAVRDAAGEFRRTLMLGVPGESPVPEGMAQLTQPNSRGWVSGRRFRHRDWPAVSAYIVVDVADAHLVAEPDYQCYHADDLEGIHKFEDGGRHLVTSDGWGLTVHPQEWRGGATLVAALDAMVPEDRHLPMPAREGIDSGQRMGLLRRWWAARKTPKGPVALGVASILLALVGIVIVAYGRFLIGGFWLVWAGITAKEAVVRWRRRVYRGLGDSKGLPPPVPQER
jgi:hypothetical protein